jgi:DNA-binding beta-propeller fold protein YncE
MVGSYGADPGQLNTPGDIAVDGLGRLYIAEEDMSQVQVLGQDGRPLAAIEGYADNSLFSPLGVAVSPDGAVYVTDTAGPKAFRVLLPTSALLNSSSGAALGTKPHQIPAPAVAPPTP